MKTYNQIISKQDILGISNTISKQSIKTHINGDNYKSLQLVTSIDRVGKLESIFIIYMNDKEMYQTSYLDKAIEEYNKLNI